MTQINILIPKLKSMMFKLRSIRLSFLKFLLASNDVFHQSLATAVQLQSTDNAFYVKYQSITLRSQSLQRHISVAATTRPLR
jgi:hypothetical protein